MFDLNRDTSMVLHRSTAGICKAIEVFLRFIRVLNKKQPDASAAPSLGGIAFRFRFTLPESLAIQSNEQYVDFTSGETSRILFSAVGSKDLKSAKQIAVKGGPFTTEEEALAAGERARRALMLCLTRMRIGASFGLDEPRSVLTNYGRQYFEQQLGQRVLQDLPQVIAFDDNVPTKFARLNMRPVVGKPPDQLQRVFRSALDLAPEFSEREQLALELFGTALFEQSERARFVTLMIAIEALLEPKERSSKAIEMVESFAKQVQANTELSKSERDSLFGTVRWLKLESINRTGRNLAGEALAGHQYLGMTPDSFFKLCYEVRSEIVHTGAVRSDGADIKQLAPELECFVADLICARFHGLAEYP